MKNTHIIPTEKPSRLFYNVGGALLFTNYENHNGVNIYITSNGEIKEGVDQWYLDKVLNEPYNSGGAQYSSKQNVIILTTDQDLIKDGVQAIDYEFLEWFVKNPNCEEVEVVDDTLTIKEAFKVPLGTRNHKYKTIIPKEEHKQLSPEDFGLPQFGTKEFNDLASQCFGGKPKQDALNHFSSTSSVIVKDPQISNFNKQETLEEVAQTKFPHKLFVKVDVTNKKREAFIDGAKWQAERSYSLDEIKTAMKNGYGIKYFSEHTFLKNLNNLKKK